MRVHSSLLLGSLVLGSCAGSTPPGDAPAAARPSNTDSQDVFTREGLEGTFVLRDEVSGHTLTTDASMADRGFRPQSTFKIANGLIGLETGIIEGEDHLWRWDGRPRALPAWEQDLDLEEALRVSCVPCFQDVARRVGEGRMRRYLREFDYGNQSISGPIDQFWLTGPLRITPREQVEFIHRMLEGELPVESENVERVWRSLELASGPDFTFRGKTGLGSLDGRAIGWLVGYVERDGHRWVYATFVRSRPGADVEAESARLLPLRESITRELLIGAGVLPSG